MRRSTKSTTSLTRRSQGGQGVRTLWNYIGIQVSVCVEDGVHQVHLREWDNNVLIGEFQVANFVGDVVSMIPPLGAHLVELIKKDQLLIHAMAQAMNLEERELNGRIYHFGRSFRG